MQDLSEILTSAATLIKQAEEMDAGPARENIQSAARALLKTAEIQLAPGAVPAPEYPDPDPAEIEEEDD